MVDARPVSVKPDCSHPGIRNLFSEDKFDSELLHFLSLLAGRNLPSPSPFMRCSGAGACRPKPLPAVASGWGSYLGQNTVLWYSSRADCCFSVAQDVPTTRRGAGVCATGFVNPCFGCIFILSKTNLQETFQNLKGGHPTPRPGIYPGFRVDGAG